ncbi:hypothetical protein K3725_04900 [Leisingera sp. S132]|uniref:M12 family metallopeptidase n=1 Tax=Leisingera sp. S132 TaxID=2867016 RepID=UPI0021A45248|nr:M12 family metallopeptidase [Leisingera sp. S132]UWQ80353.1 hypothetical protein K3725_04900 [Leisingera sp. S132]
MNRICAILLVCLPTAAAAQFTKPSLGERGPDNFARIVVGPDDYGYVLLDAIWSNVAIPVCWEDPQPETEAYRAAVRKAIDETWVRYSKLLFSGWEACADGNVRGIRIRIANDHPHVKALGKRLSGVPDGMVLNAVYELDGFDVCLANDTMYDLCTRAIAVHEFGHAIGLSHEHNRTDRDSACTEAPQGTQGDEELTPYDPDSVMNYCNPDYGNFGKLSHFDVLSVQLLYGEPE